MQKKKVSKWFSCVYSCFCFSGLSLLCRQNYLKIHCWTFPPRVHCPLLSYPHLIHFSPRFWVTWDLTTSQPYLVSLSTLDSVLCLGTLQRTSPCLRPDPFPHRAFAVIFSLQGIFLLIILPSIPCSLNLASSLIFNIFRSSENLALSSRLGHISLSVFITKKLRFHIKRPCRIQWVIECPNKMPGM